jgi:hypothetical protein
MSVYIQEIDLNLLIYGLKQYADDISQESAEQLQTAIVAVQNHEPNSEQNLISLVSQDTSLDRLYAKSLKARTQGYITQERAKSLDLNLHQPLTTELYNAVDQLARTIAQLLTQREKQYFTTAKETILKKLTTTHLRTQDLSYVLNQPLDRTQTIIQQLWKTGYIDRLDSSILYILFPNLRPETYRNHPPTPDLFLTLTTKGYFHLYPLIQWARRGEH